MPNALDEAIAAFPWLQRLGLVDQIRAWTVDGYEGEALLGLVRQTDQYRGMFPGINRPDGTLRTNEAQYLQTQDDYRRVLRSWGQPDHAYDSPFELQKFFEGDVSPNELQQRFQVYDQIKGGAAPIRDAFYVYAGMRLSDDDLYNYVLDPTYRDGLDREYTQRAASTNLDYPTFITRATELGLERVASTLTDLQKQGVVTGDAIARVRNLSPDFARQMVDALYTGGDPTGGGFLGLDELTNAFQYAMIGGAAAAQGLSMPTLERVKAFRQAGIDQAKAQQGYSQYAQNRGAIAGAVQRAGGGVFGQSEFEQAMFLQSASEAELLRRAQAQEEAMGARQGAANFGMKDGALTQAGLRARW